MEGQPFFTSIAGLAVSLAGFGAVIAWLRDDPSGWDPVNLWRVKTIVRHSPAGSPSGRPRRVGLESMVFIRLEGG